MSSSVIQAPLTPAVRLPTAVQSTDEERSHARCRHRFHCAHRDRQGLPGRVQQHPWRHPRRPRGGRGREAGRPRPRGSRGRHLRLRAAGRRHRSEHRPPGGPAGGAARHHGRRHRQPLLLLGHAGHRDGGAPGHRRSRAGDGRGRRRVGLARAERALQQSPDPRAVDRRAQARALPAHDRHRGSGGEALLRHARDAGRVRAGEPAAHGGRPEGRALRRRDRPDDGDQAHAGPEYGRGARGAGDAHQGRGQPAGHIDRRPREPGARARGEGAHHRRATRASSRTARRPAWSWTPSSRSSAA